MKLLNSGNAKTLKGEKVGFRTFGLHLSPATKSGFNVCQWASAGCRAACLDTAGRGCMSNVQNSRIAKTRRFFKDNFGFMSDLRIEIGKAIKSAARKNLTPCFRLNLTSDIPWENMKKGSKTSVIEEFPEVNFYDYTKGFYRMRKWLDGKMPKNYHLTFSRSEETSDDRIKKILSLGGNVAVVFRGSLPKTYLGFPVVDGDENDLRFKDKKGVIVGLVEKGLAKKDETGFVVEPA
tara:strand:+ start:240 stop:944 length:705 start_codon:yes stop_codon:yes gene_type:complete